jgi:tRNA-specific 2-thiouridylase
VDSSVTAALLREAGHEVVGVTLRLHDQDDGDPAAAAEAAREVAARLGIAHHVLDARETFFTQVIADFAATYARGATPVPCVRCNRHLKFAALLALADKLGCERLATGHYARLRAGAEGVELHQARDLGRDQSWFLYAVGKEQLARGLFPLGDAPDKAWVRTEAARFGLPVANRPDSQDICFVPRGEYAAVVARLRPEALAEGEIVTIGGEVVGRHQGIARYTVGQSRRLGAAARLGDVRQVVVALDAPARRVVVGPAGGGVRRVVLGEVNWLVTPEAQHCRVKLRARDALRPALVRPTADGAEVELDAPALPAPGQACVFYRGSRVLGGGIIGGRPGNE